MTNGPVKLVRTSEYGASFSFFSFVFVNPSTSDIETKEIVNHESEHIQQKHWFDLLLVELLCMLQWFNPFVWIYSHLIRQNHEYLADEMALQRTSDPAIYQATLLNQMFGGPVISLANSFSYSLNKKRFKMMKKNIHSPFRKLKLLLVLPLLALVFYAFAKPEYIISPAPDVKTDMVSLVNGSQDAKGGIVKGKVVNPDGKPLAETSVVIKGTTKGTITDQDGNFVLNDVPNDAELVFSYVGYQTVQTKSDAENSMLIKMASQTVEIDKVVVVGYGDTKTPGSSTEKFDSNHPPLYVIDGVITEKRTAEYFKSVGVESVTVLKGKSATDKYGEKGKDGVMEITLKKNLDNGTHKNDSTKTVVRISGNNTKNPPLILLDGVVIDKAQMDAFSRDKIESISILKDKSSTALYGEAGKDGVILITSKGKAATSFQPQMQRMTYTPGKGTTTTDVYTVVEQMPQFPGGERALMQFIRANFRYPTSAAETGVQGKVLVNFIVSSTGKVESAKVINSVHPALDAEALRVVNSMPDWLPGKQHGEAVDVAYVLPVEFMLQTKDEKSKGIVTGPIPTQISPEEDVAFVVVEQMPQFPGGEEAMMKFIRDNLKYPAVAKKQGVQGTVIIHFVVNKSGKITRIKVIRGIGAGCDEEAVRVIGMMPDWSPGMQGGKAVNVAYTVPFKFKLQ